MVSTTKIAILVGTTALLPLSMLAPAQTGGLSPEWDVRKMLSTFEAQIQRLKPILDQVNPQEWKAEDVPATYATQWKGVEDELGYLSQTIEKLKKEPERTTLTLEAYLRLQSIETMTGSVIEGVRKYQNPAVAELLQGVLTEIAPNRAKFRDHLIELVAAKEAEFKIMDKEAQRCRAQLLRQPAKPTARKSRE
jgi:predicted phage-related endonuclease